MKIRKCRRLNSSAKSKGRKEQPFEDGQELETGAEVEEIQCTNPAARDKALQNPLVLSEVMEGLDFLDLRACRLVNQIWLNISSFTMLKKDCCQVKLICDWEEPIHPHFRKVSRRRKGNIVKTPNSHDVEELNKILLKSKNFPSTTCFIYGGKFLVDPNMWTFFSIYGDKIKTLQIRAIDDDEDEYFVSQEVFRKILLQVPNVEKLMLRDLQCIEEKPSEEEDNKLFFPFLKSFSWDRCYAIAVSIMLGAPNLEVLENFGLQEGFLKAVIDADKVALLKEISCDKYTNAIQLYSFVCLGGRQLKLKTIKFDINQYVAGDEVRIALSSSFNALLEASKDSVEVLQLSEVCSFYDIRLPTFSCLKELAVGKHRKQFWKQIGKCFPPRTNLATTFPKLQLLDCTGVMYVIYPTWNGDIFSSADALRGDFSTVQTLEIMDSCREKWMLKIHNLCPKFKRLVVHSEGEPHLFLPEIFRIWQHLESLEIIMKGWRLFNLDVTFTGISAVHCARLRARDSEEREKGYKKLPHQPGIPKLAELKRLKIQFHPDSYNDLEYFLGVEKRTLISRVSGLYGFSLIPDLKVSIEFDHNGPLAEDIKEALQSIAPYVKLTHRHHFD